MLKFTSKVFPKLSYSRKISNFKLKLENKEPNPTKKDLKLYNIQLKKQEKELERLEREKSIKNLREQKIELSKHIITKNALLPAPNCIKLTEAKIMRGKRVKISGWVHRLRTQGKMMFIVLRDGYGLLQCVFTGNLSQTFDALTLTLESTICVYGVLKEVPEGKSAPGGHELQCDYWELISKAPGGDEAFSNKIAADSSPKLLLDQRHLVLRGDIASSCMKFRALTIKAFRGFFDNRKVTEVSPPLIVKTQAEGGSNVFELSYYKEKV